MVEDGGDRVGNLGSAAQMSNKSACVNPSRGRRSAGFTLIELMVAVTIMVIVAAVAIPIYTDFADRGYRTEAQGDLMACAQGMERWASENFDYLGAADSDNDGAGDSDAGSLAAEVCTPTSVAQGRYNITVNATATAFTLTATPIGAMAGDGFMTLDDTGARAWDENADGDTTDAGEDSWEH